MPTKKIQKKQPKPLQNQKKKIKGVTPTQTQKKQVKGAKSRQKEKEQSNNYGELQYEYLQYYDPQNDKMKKLAPCQVSNLNNKKNNNKQEKLIYTTSFTYFPDIPKNGDSTVLGSFDDLKLAQLNLFRHMHKKMQEMEQEREQCDQQLLDQLGKQQEPKFTNGFYSQNCLLQFNWLLSSISVYDYHNQLWQIQASYLNKV